MDNPTLNTCYGKNIVKNSGKRMKIVDPIQWNFFHVPYSIFSLKKEKIKQTSLLDEEQFDFFTKYTT